MNMVICIEETKCRFCGQVLIRIVNGIIILAKDCPHFDALYFAGESAYLKWLGENPDLTNFRAYRDWGNAVYVILPKISVIDCDFDLEHERTWKRWGRIDC